ncbi:hypothetical protein ABPG75_000611 [Micractinium tetrahymenae]
MITPATAHDGCLSHFLHQQGRPARSKPAAALAGAGSYYLPSGYRGRVLRLAVLLHGSNQDGSKLVAAFQQLAEDKSFIVVTPDSNSPYGWYPGDEKTPGEDMPHVRACLAEVRRMAGVQVDADRILVAGFSAGAQFAPFVGSAFRDFSAVAVMHGSMSGGNQAAYDVVNWPHLWFSSSRSDRLGEYAASVAELKKFCNLPSMTIIPKDKYSGGHAMSTEEKTDMINWQVTDGCRQQGAGSRSRSGPAGTIPQLPATTASARALQQRLALGTYYALAIKKDGSILSAAIPGRNCSFFLTGNCPVCIDTCAVPRFVSRPAVALAASPIGGQSRYVALSKSGACVEGTLEYFDENGKGCALSCSAAVSKACVRGIKAVAEGLRNVMAVAAGDGFSVALLASGSVSVWPALAEDLRYAGMPSEVASAAAGNKVVAVAATDNAFALLANGTLLAWGPDYQDGGGQPTVQALGTGILSFQAQYTTPLSVGTTFILKKSMLLVRQDGSLWFANLPQRQFSEPPIRRVHDLRRLAPPSTMV